MWGWKTQRERISDLEQGLRRLEGVCNDLDVEWSVTYEKIRTLMARLAKRSRRAEAPELEEVPAVQDGPQSVDTITARVLARRAPHGVPGDVQR